jgi:hypothetical protein
VAARDVRQVTGAVVAVDVIRAFTTAAYAFAAGAREIFLVADTAEALALKRSFPGLMLVGEDAWRRRRIPPVLRRPLHFVPVLFVARLGFPARLPFQ